MQFQTIINLVSAVVTYDTQGYKVKKKKKRRVTAVIRFYNFKDPQPELLTALTGIAVCQEVQQHMLTLGQPWLTFDSPENTH